MLLYMVNDEVGLVNLSLERDAKHACLMMVLHSSTVLWGSHRGLNCYFY